MTAKDEELTDKPDEPVVVRDRRKVDPETGELRQQETQTDLANEVAADAAASPGEGLAGPGGVASSSSTAELEKELAERTADLQRVQAEYANYRKRTERDRDAVSTNGKVTVIDELLPLLDDIERADAHGDLTGAFKSVADKLLYGLHQAGLEPFGTEGDTFDPSVHEAVQHTTSDDVDRPTVTSVLRRGYQLDERVVRSAMVAVTENESAIPEVPGDVVPENGPAGQTAEHLRTSDGEQEQN